MLISCTIENWFSFKESQTLRMEAVDTERDNINLDNVIHANPKDSERLLKSALIFGANASGKTNFIKALLIVRSIMLDTRLTLDEERLPARSAIPYLLSKETMQQPSGIEIVFYEDNTKYRYGLEIQTGKIVAEWLFFTPRARETMLFIRDKDEIEYNKTSFSEGSAFVEGQKLKNVREVDPLVSVIASSNGKHSSNLIRWINRIRAADGLDDFGYMRFTMELLKKDENFKKWALEILREFSIDNIVLEEIEVPSIEFGAPDLDDNAKQVFSAISRLAKNKKQLKLNVIKPLEDKKTFIEFPLDFESAGTKKLIHLLGPIYDSIKNKRVLLIDEFESKFHSLLSKALFKIIHQNSSEDFQVIVTAHDTNLMDTRYFRRDQIWFVNKEEVGGSQIYSLVEFKEKARKLKEQYGPDYLAGSFGAISLFERFGQIDKVMVDG